MKENSRKYLMILLLGILALVSVYADTKEYPGLDVVWSFDAGMETFSFGFVADKPAAELNQGWSDVKVASDIPMKDYIQNSTTFYKAYGKVYAYWNFFSNQSITVMLGSTGPFTVNDPKNNYNNRNQINWTATWTPMSVNENGDIVELAGEQMSIGRDDNLFTDGNEDYASKLIFKQDAYDYPLKSKYGFTRIDIETQDTKASDITSDYRKVKGNYSTSLILDVNVR